MAYIYKNPRECIRALTLIREQMMYQGKDESVNALETAIGYLTSMQIEIDMRKKPSEEPPKPSDCPWK